jgi:uncharacterized protein (TIGR02246 family)
MTRFGWTMIGVVLLAARSVPAQESQPAAEDPAHNELRALRDGMLDAFEKQDIDRMLTFMAPDVVIVVQNADVIRGHEGVRDFHKRMSEGEDRAVESMTSDLKVDELSMLYGDDTAISFGTMDDHFKLRRGMEFDLHSRWTATAVRQNERWQLASFHVSTNMFDNGVSNLYMKWTAMTSGGIALLAGLVVGAVISAWWKRRPAPPADTRT